MSRPIGTAAELERRRRRAVEAVRGGERQAAVARALGVGRGTISRWLQQADQPGGLAPRLHPAPHSRLSIAQQRRLDRLLRQGADAHGWPNRLWTTARVAQLIRRHFGVSYHPDHVGRFLRQRLGWSCQKPRRQARERKDAEIDHWRCQTFPRIVREARRRGAHLVFLDESGYMLTPTVRRTWAPRGQTPILSSWDRRDRMSAISAITVSPTNGRVNLYFDVLADNANVTAADVVDFLRQLRSRLRGPLTIVWDGSNTHSRSTAVRAFLADHPGVVAETLPPYAPELNPDELVWGWSKHGRLANLAAADTGWLRDHVIGELVDLKGRPQLLRSFIRRTGLSLAA
jgi:transposase